MLHIFLTSLLHDITFNREIARYSLLKILHGSVMDLAFYNVEVSTAWSTKVDVAASNVVAAGSFVSDGTHGKSRDRVSLSVWLPFCGRSIPWNTHNAPFNMSRMLQRRNSILIPSDLSLYISVHSSVPTWYKCAKACEIPINLIVPEDTRSSNMSN